MYHMLAISTTTLFTCLLVNTVNSSPTARIMESAAVAILQLVLLATWKTLSDTPFRKRNPLFARFFNSQAVFETIATTASIVFCPGLFEVLQAATPPSIRFFKSLPAPPELVNKCGVYVTVMEKPGCRPKVYVGSATSAQQGMRQSLQQYDLGLMLPQYVEDALDEGYTITHKGLLCWMPRPIASLVPVNRLLFVALEAAFTYMFWATRSRVIDYGMGHICLWDRHTLEYDGLCSHCCLNEAILGDFDLTAEQLEDQAIEKEQKRLEMKAEQATNYHYKQMVDNYDEYIGKAGRRVAKSRANNPGRNATYQANCIKKATSEKYFHCVLCNLSFGTKQKLEKHQKTPKHLRKGDEASNPFKCRPCNLGFHNQSNLTRHEKTQRHAQNMAAAQSSPELD